MSRMTNRKFEISGTGGGVVTAATETTTTPANTAPATKLLRSIFMSCPFVVTHELAKSPNARAQRVVVDNTISLLNRCENAIAIGARHPHDPSQANTGESNVNQPLFRE